MAGWRDASLPQLLLRLRRGGGEEPVNPRLLNQPGVLCQDLHELPKQLRRAWLWMHVRVPLLVRGEPGRFWLGSGGIRSFPLPLVRGLGSPLRRGELPAKP